MSAAKKMKKENLKAADEANLAFMDGNRTLNGQKFAEKKGAITSATRTRATADLVREIEVAPLLRSSDRQSGSGRDHLKRPASKDKAAEEKPPKSTRSLSKPATTLSHRPSRMPRKGENMSEKLPKTISASTPPKGPGLVKGEKRNELTRSFTTSTRTIPESKPLQNRGCGKVEQIRKPTSSLSKVARAALPATDTKSSQSSHLGKASEEDQPECNRKTARPKHPQRKKTPGLKREKSPPSKRKFVPQEVDEELSALENLDPDLENLNALDPRFANDPVAMVDAEVNPSDEHSDDGDISQMDFSPVEDDSDFHPSGDEIEAGAEEDNPGEDLQDDGSNSMEVEDAPDAAVEMSEPTDKIEPKPKSPPTIDELKMKVEHLERELDKYIGMNFILQEELHAKKDTEMKFSEVKGFFKAQWLLMMSQKARHSDYIFVKSLCVALFPNGIGNATVSGGPSPNPSGSRRNAEPNSVPEDPDKIDPVKVNYIRDRLYERRRLLSDNPLQAANAAKFTGRLITRVFANNPSLKALRE